jgi:thiamine biosynthesis protein ThiI
MKEALDGIEVTEIKVGDEYMNQQQDIIAELL